MRERLIKAFELIWRSYSNDFEWIACERGGSDGLSALRSGQSRLHRMSRPKRSEVTDDPTRPRDEVGIRLNFD